MDPGLAAALRQEVAADRLSPGLLGFGEGDCGGGGRRAGWRCSWSTARRRRRAVAELEGEVEAEGLVQRGHDRWGELAEQVSDPLEGDRSNLFCLCLGLVAQAGRAGWQQHLEWVHPLDVGGDGTTVRTPRPSRAAVVLAWSLRRRRPGVACWPGAGRIEIDHAKLAAASEATVGDVPQVALAGGHSTPPTLDRRRRAAAGDAARGLLDGPPPSGTTGRARARRRRETRCLHWAGSH